MKTYLNQKAAHLTQGEDITRARGLVRARAGGDTEELTENSQGGVTGRVCVLGRCAEQGWSAARLEEGLGRVLVSRHCCENSSET